MIAYFAEKRKDAPPGENGRRVPIGGEGGKNQGKVSICEIVFDEGDGEMFT